MCFNIPKGARSLVAEKLCSILENCLRTNSVEDWFSLLSFSFSTLRVPKSVAKKSLTSLMNDNVDNTLYFPDITTRKPRLRQQHLKELTISSACSNGSRLVDSNTNLCNFFLKVSLYPMVCTCLYGASLCALSKRDGPLGQLY